MSKRSFTVTIRVEGVTHINVIAENEEQACRIAEERFEEEADCGILENIDWKATNVEEDLTPEVELQWTTLCVDEDGIPELENQFGCRWESGTGTSPDKQFCGECNRKTPCAYLKEYLKNKYVGRIDYLSPDGSVSESIEYDSEYSFKKDIKDESYYGVPMVVVFYENSDGNTIDRSFLNDVEAFISVRTEKI